MLILIVTTELKKKKKCNIYQKNFYFYMGLYQIIHQLKKVMKKLTIKIGTHES